MFTQFLATTPEVFYGAIFLLSLLLVIFSIPSIIHASLKYKLFDVSDLHRKSHAENISRLGGLSIVSSFTICTLLFSAFISFKEANFLIVSCIILAGLGLKDDVYGTNTSTKFLLQLIVASILVFFGDFRLTSLYGVLGINEINYLGGGVFSIILIIFLNNAFNLIDGIDGLAGTIGILASLSFGVCFAIMHQLPYAFIAFALAGAIAGFLKYNWFPAKIFMGDTGALIIGLTTAALAIKFIELNKFTGTNTPAFYSAPAIAVSILIVPIFDSLRIFTVRILKKRSPFLGDRNHIHHRLEDLGFKPDKIVMLTVILNCITMFSTIFLQHMGSFLLIFLLIGICMIFNLLISRQLTKQSRLRSVNK
ncbi:UDP-N-acetylmuramyl pentapeptide phosphotransferase/UDP-N-acetylglucosamine-1-phosphate transferase [Pedobacter psychrotolerans]|uniref:UDP-N-acetylmuramyl pentapeptide phosphotransferase/UDP-N-acetylglucosamine-1-phosphate transferase n=1 Tax=Pedobacter psychrotolerans TaxID=1843235 RepID=A0A4R2HM60_9SPHI|nr:MraY family glycosyltransferase [Pedobacter psychrotolerans]TCO30825.1 UDP-N-acetylmuramyl pentapeptide phosphotransferase/UDP-N-acetylglucosamine-1-phosphate transferase [Pedobacter psychrotolerans]GGE44193.1 undecaprenyl-phosphate alpha-N-acetylglucosaminyl 1-phosphate transferase [Pedobacter psychrotolerans]